jgi:hypothetical protein
VGAPSPAAILASVPFTTHTQWETEGFPALLEELSMEVLQAEPTGGQGYSSAPGEARVVLETTSQPEWERGWGGISGAPVFVAGTIHGVIYAEQEG